MPHSAFTVTRGAVAWWRARSHLAVEPLCSIKNYVRGVRATARLSPGIDRTRTIVGMDQAKPATGMYMLEGRKLGARRDSGRPTSLRGQRRHSPLKLREVSSRQPISGVKLDRISCFRIIFNRNSGLGPAKSVHFHICRKNVRIKAPHIRNHLLPSVAIYLRSGLQVISCFENCVEESHANSFLH